MDGGRFLPGFLQHSVRVWRSHRSRALDCYRAYCVYPGFMLAQAARETAAELLLCFHPNNIMFDGLVRERCMIDLSGRGCFQKTALQPPATPHAAARTLGTNLAGTW